MVGWYHRLSGRDLSKLLEIEKDRGTWCVSVHGVTKSLMTEKTKHTHGSVQFSRSVMSHSLRPHEPAACQASLSITNSRCLLKIMSIKSVMPSNHLILCRPLLPPSSIFPSIRVFSNESALSIRWPKYWSFSFNISPFNEYSGPISFRMDWLDLLAVQGTLKSLLKHHSSKASILQCSAFFYSPTLTSIHYHWKNHSLD